MSFQTEHQQKRKNLAEHKKQSQQEKKQILENMMQRNFWTEQLWGHEEFPDRVLKVRTASGKQNSQITNERRWKAYENICRSHKQKHIAISEEHGETEYFKESLVQKDGLSADKNVLCRVEHTTPCLHGVPAIFASDKTICIPKPTKTYNNNLLLVSGNGNSTTKTKGAARQ